MAIALVSIYGENANKYRFGWLVSNLGQVRSNGVELSTKLGADLRDGRNDNNGDEASDQTVFDSGGA